MADEKAEGAFRTIGELSDELGLPQHILRYWETKFPQLRPLQRAGNRRYYRTADVALVKRIDGLLNREGYTVKGVQKLLAAKGGIAAAEPAAGISPAEPPSSITLTPTIRSELRAIRDDLMAALAGD
jgi:DNA-binding transcriptional MerR regulator